MGIKEASRAMEFSITDYTIPSLHVGWRNAKPVYAVFTLKMAEIVFREFRQPIAICVAPPIAAFADTYEQAVAFFSGGEAREFVEKNYFDADVA